MKVRILIFTSLTVAASLTAFGFIKNNEFVRGKISVNLTDGFSKQAAASCNSSVAFHTSLVSEPKPDVLTDFFYDIGPRFQPISKRDLAEARAVSDFIDQDETASLDAVRSTTIIIVENETQTGQRISGKSHLLTPNQLDFINSMDYSSSFLLEAVFSTKDPRVESKGENIYRPHMTVVPEKQAVYEGGKNAVLEYLRVNNEKNIYNLDESELRPAMLYFTVTKDGEVENVRLDRTSGYSEIDNAMLYLANHFPGEWLPAEDGLGEKIDQELVIFFGMVGC